MFRSDAVAVAVLETLCRSRLFSSLHAIDFACRTLRVQPRIFLRRRFSRVETDSLELILSTRTRTD